MKESGIYLIIDENNSHCGITDRLKTAVGLCYVAQQNHLNFKFIHRVGFDLREFLIPNKINWSADLSDITCIPWRKKNIIYYHPFNDFPVFKKNIQYICKNYRGNNIIEMKGIPDWQKVWRDLFWDMFKPTPRVLETLAQISLPDRYAVVNVRFINALGFCEATDYNAPFPEEIQGRIIQSVLSKIADASGNPMFPSSCIPTASGFSG